MQAQQQKPIRKQRLSVVEIVVAVLNLLIGTVSMLSGSDLLRNSTEFFQSLAGGIMLVAGLSAGLVALFVTLHQRKLAVMAQWLASIGIAAFGALTAWIMLKDGLTDPSFSNLIFMLIPLIILPLLFAWFAWFLKRMDDGE